MSLKSPDAGAVVTPTNTPNVPKLGILLQEVTKLFLTGDGDDARVGIQNVNLAVDKKEFVCIIGPSGCGKTTILNLLVGLMPADSGELLIDGVPLADAQFAAKMGYMLARDSLLPWRSAQKNVEIAMEVGYHKVANRRERRERARELLELMGLSGHFNSFPSQLSQGMRQRVAIARTLACEPNIFLMDEPFGALDAQTRRYMHEELIHIWEADPKSVLFVTHDLDEALALADRVVVVNGRPGTITSEFPISVPRQERLEGGSFHPDLFAMRHEMWNELRRGSH
jgi:NitT/TauT family transport system ATP-binding protein